MPRKKSVPAKSTVSSSSSPPKAPRQPKASHRKKEGETLPNFEDIDEKIDGLAEEAGKEDAVEPEVNLEEVLGALEEESLAKMKDDDPSEEEEKTRQTVQEKPTSRQEDYDLIDQICQGEPQNRDQSYKRLLNKYRGQIYNLILKIIHNPNEVDDLVQETFSKAFNSIENFNKEYAFSTWLYRIATNSSIDFLRKRRLKTLSIDNPISAKEDEYTIEIPDTSDEPGKNIIQGQRDELVQAAIKSLPPKYRKVIEMRHLQERTYEEIAADLDLPLGTVKAHIFRAREMLYKLLRDKLRNF
jgi:RNA polymerase sigma factor (sigma-70 family)